MVHTLRQQEPRISRTDGTYGIVLAPTRELGLQIFEVTQSLLQYTPWVVPCLLTGGEKKKSEKARLRKGVSILVSTPGRLLDHLETTTAFNVRPLRWLVLDEADRLLDMGFEKKLSLIMQTLKQRDAEYTTAESFRRESRGEEPLTSSTPRRIQNILISGLC